MKLFLEALYDGFKHVDSISDPERLKDLRGQDIQIDTDGLWVFEFGEHKEYSFEVQPLPEDGQYRIVLYKNGVVLTEPLRMKAI